MNTSSKRLVADAIRALPDSLQASAARWFERHDDLYADAEIPETMIGSLTRLVAVSDFAATTALKEWLWIDEQRELLSAAPDLRHLEAFVHDIAAGSESVDTVKQRLRRYRNRYLLHVLWREIEGAASLTETLTALSVLADRLLDAAACVAERQLQPRFGVVRNESGERVSIVILAMGKLGGGELNFSSDIDIIFLYPDAVESDGARPLSAAEYFARLSRQIIALLDEVTSDGFVFRIDTRLRPFGDSGPPVVSFAALESYLLQHGRDWERYAYVKARIVGPAAPSAVIDELHNDLITPFVYRRYLDFGVFESLRNMHTLIAAEVSRRELGDNIKLGPGGIREIEFIVQSLQLVRGGSRTEIQGRSLQQVVPRLVGQNGITAAAAETLLAAYEFLRRVENFIQGMRDRQLHELPKDEVDRERLTLAMRYPTWGSLLADLNAHRKNVTRQFSEIAFRQREPDSDDPLKRQLAELWVAGAQSAEWTAVLADAGFQSPQELAGAITGFADASSTQRVESTARHRLREFVPDLLLLLRDSERAPLALQRMLAIVEQVLRRSAYLALLNENNSALARLVGLCERSAYIADQIARYPILLDELLDARSQTGRMTRADFDADLQQRLYGTDAGDSETRMELVGQFQRASQFRIALADFTGSLPIMRVSDCLTDLAETVLNFVLRVAWQDMVDRHGAPEYVLDGERHKAGFGIIAYGKFGGIELSYRSDLDLVFLHDSQGANQVTNGVKPLDNSMFFTRLVRRLSHFLTTQTGSGLLYEVDTRLRPDGQSGLLVSSIDAFERYQEENAWTWEHQALLRARPVAGSALIAREFERIRVDTLTMRVHRETLAADVSSMRRRMRDRLSNSDAGHFDLKAGRGGITDIEFIVQYLVLSNSAEHRAVIHYPDNIRQLATLAAAGCIATSSAARVQDIYRGYRRRLHHLSLDGKSPVVSADEFVAEREFINDLWEKLLGD
jgi:glutamate-ammonia-ligase adenylyltransferase